MKIPLSTIFYTVYGGYVALKMISTSKKLYKENIFYSLDKTKEIVARVINENALKTCLPMSLCTFGLISPVLAIPWAVHNIVGTLNNVLETERLAKRHAASLGRQIGQSPEWEHKPDPTKLTVQGFIKKWNQTRHSLDS